MQVSKVVMQTAKKKRKVHQSRYDENKQKGDDEVAPDDLFHGVLLGNAGRQKKKKKKKKEGKREKGGKVDVN